ncbi:protein lifeguard 1-like [Ornithodoros turicata]|uniref:protein lifeguard 1-like n=1 Tax=Ornithodoros turicata TaxID=34597 RepID=UPI003138B255
MLKEAAIVICMTVLASVAAGYRGQPRHGGYEHPREPGVPKSPEGSYEDFRYPSGPRAPKRPRAPPVGSPQFPGQGPRAPTQPGGYDRGIPYPREPRNPYPYPRDPRSPYPYPRDPRNPYPYPREPRVPEGPLGDPYRRRHGLDCTVGSGNPHAGCDAICTRDHQLRGYCNFRSRNCECWRS